MGWTVLVTGGSRSGKSDHAMRLGQSMEGPRAFVATCPPLDEEMLRRIRKHQESRDPGLWETVEEPIEAAAAIRNSREYKVILVDCLTLWINNLMYKAEQEGRSITEEEISLRCEELRDACESVDSHVILVTNEVGMGVVPDNPGARLYRDLVGRCNQIVAAGADEVVLVSCGIPLKLKGN